MILRKLLLAFVLIGANPAIGLAKEGCGCSELLKDGVWQTRIEASQEDQVSAWKAFLCSSDQGKIQSAAKSSGGIGGEFFEILKFDANAANDKSRLEEWKKISCSAEERSGDTKRFNILVHKVADRNLVEAFDRCTRSCSAGGGLFCDLQWEDANTARFTAKYTRVSESGTIPKIINGQFSGGKQTTVDLTGRSPIRPDASIPSVGRGIVAIFEPNPKSTKIIVNLETDVAGSCEAATPDITADYAVNVAISGFATKRKPLKKSLSISLWDKNGSCTEGHKVRDFSVCFTSGVVTAVHLSGSKGTAWHRESVRADPNNKNCGILRLEYRDNGRNAFGDCKGHGRTAGTITINGYKDTQVPIPERTLNAQITVPFENSGSTSISYPLTDIKGLRAPQFSFVANATRRILRNDQNFSATDGATDSGDFKATISNNGVVTISVGGGAAPSRVNEPSE